MKKSTSAAHSLRTEQANVAADRIITAALAMIEADEEPTMRAVAARAGIAERTVYRHFPSLDVLQTALIPHLRPRVGHPLCESTDELADYARALYSSFDLNRGISRTLATATWAQAILKRTRRENLTALRNLIATDFPGAPAEEIEAAAIALRIPLSAAGWMYFEDCGISREARVAHVTWLITAVLGRLVTSRNARTGEADAKR